MNERREVFYTDLASLADGEKETRLTANKWICVPYETAEFNGVALIASETCQPSVIRSRLNANGWYKIYLYRIQKAYMYIFSSQKRYFVVLREWERAINK